MKHNNDALLWLAGLYEKIMKIVSFEESFVGFLLPGKDEMENVFGIHFG